jgi:thiamine pyrophosphate-dependent acetolactate synthase large subunit-like protein
MLEYLGEAAAGREFVAMDLTEPELRFDRMAEAMGMPGKRVEQLDDLPSALQEAMLHRDGPYLLDVVVESPLPGR